MRIIGLALFVVLLLDYIITNLSTQYKLSSFLYFGVRSDSVCCMLILAV